NHRSLRAWCLRRILKSLGEVRGCARLGTRSEEGFSMLPNLRVAIAAVVTGIILIVTAFGLAATVRIAQHARIGPIEKFGPIERPRTLAYADPGDWEPGPHPTRVVPPLSSDHGPEIRGSIPEDPPPAASPHSNAVVQRPAEIATDLPASGGDAGDK